MEMVDIYDADHKDQGKIRRGECGRFVEEFEVI
jgi:hypothetical protein